MSIQSFSEYSFEIIEVTIAIYSLLQYLPLLLLSGFFSHSGQQKNGVGQSLELWSFRDRIPSITERSLRLRLRFTYTSDVTERSPKLGWCSLNPQLLIFRWKQECKPPLLLHPLGNG
ncbi:hypothetical protein H6F78_11665 [Coleofasciculus sp. FACHB-64]|uniref:hypothetical protein n=1 Tax=Cyanophyceae TaxID=3028117 RepID=UPI001688969D|nr:hypothetical protein [Coleofasciculus sp. FACHB-64]MBD2046241.1 hypothetical protein [Coleofasciculus sp. FACHB-64]